jgi:hypothetical protein
LHSVLRVRSLALLHRCSSKQMLVKRERYIRGVLWGGAVLAMIEDAAESSAAFAGDAGRGFAATLAGDAFAIGFLRRFGDARLKTTLGMSR